MENLTLVQPFTQIGSLREALKYRSREAMGKNWRTIFADQILPEDHQTVEPAQVLTFVTEISKPQKGRPGTITGAAQQLLASFSHKEQALEVSEKQVEPVLTFQERTIEQPEPKPDLFDKLWAKVSNLSGLDWVYLVTIGIADYGLTYLLKEMGIAAAIVYSLISLHALSMAKNRKSQVTAQTGIAAVWFLEILAFFIHLTLFNLRLWDSIRSLPFYVDNPAMESRPFWIACVFAAIFSAAGIYAVSVTLSLLKESIEAENFEATHGVKY